MKEIEIRHIMSFDSVDESPFHSDCLLMNDFTIDCANAMIVPNYLAICHESKSGAFKDSLENVIKDERELDRIKLDRFLEEFEKLEFAKSDNVCIRKRTMTRWIAVTQDNGEKSIFIPDRQSWINLAGLLCELVGFDVLNLESTKNLITDLHYKCRNDGVYEKKTGKKLKLKSLRYIHGPVLCPFKAPRLEVDFEEAKIRGCCHSDDVPDETLNLILNLLEDYHIYELDDERFWQKLSRHPWRGFDGYEWELSMTFEGDRHWIIGMDNDYPDVFVHLARKVIELTGTDILNVASIGNNDLKLYEKCGDMILNVD